MRKLVLAVVLLALFSAALVTIAAAVTTHMLSLGSVPGSTITVQANSDGNVGGGSWAAADYSSWQGASQISAPSYAQGDCPNHRGASQDSSPSY